MKLSENVNMIFDQMECLGEIRQNGSKSPEQDWMTLIWSHIAMQKLSTFPTPHHFPSIHAECWSFFWKLLISSNPKKKCTHSTLLQINRTLSTLVDQISCLFETHFIKFISGPFSISCGKPHPKAVLWQIRMLEYFSGAKFTKQKKNNKHQRYLQTFWLCFRYFWIKNSPRWNFLPKIACVTG